MMSQAQHGRLISHSANLLYLLGKRERQLVLVTESCEKGIGH
jgi:hypothetical protein